MRRRTTGLFAAAGHNHSSAVSRILVDQMFGNRRSHIPMVYSYSTARSRADDLWTFLARIDCAVFPTTLIWRRLDERFS